METKVQLKNLYLIAVIAIGLIGLGVGSTFAMFTASTSIDNPIAFSSNLSSTNNLAETIEVVVPAGEDKNVDIVISNTSSDSLNYTAWYSPTSNDLVVGSTSSNNSYGTVGLIPSDGSFTLTVQLRNKGDTPITVTIGVSSSDSQVVIPEGTAVIPSTQLIPYAAKYITNLYTTATKSTTTVNSITYNLAPSVNLMNDRHASMDIDIDDGNIRYYGANAYNYVDIGDRTSNDEVILWRIIGVFDGKLRIVRNEAIGKYLYDTSASNVNSGQGVNEWSQADLMKLLNPGYDAEAIGGSLWYKSGSGSYYFGQNNGTTECDFTSTGLSNKSKDYIIDQTVYLGSGDNSSIYPDQAYIMERGNSVRTCTDVKVCNDTVERTSSWTGKVALMYPSDYGYAVDLSLCKKTLSAYDDSTCVNNNWLKVPIGWLITPYTSDNYREWAIVGGGYVARGRGYYADYNVRPVVTLKENIIFESGTGKSTDPFVVA